MGTLLEIKTKANIAIRFNVQIEIGEGTTSPSEAVVQEINAHLANLKEGFSLQ